VVCNACGRKTQDAHLFCGTCGTSLPHAPLAIAGAESTLNFTRIPRIYPVQSERQQTHKGESSISSERTGVLVDTSSPPNGDAAGSSQTATSARETVLDRSMATPEVPPYLSNMGATQSHFGLMDGLESRDIVTEVPWDEYVGPFHYKPLDKPEEVILQGDAVRRKSETPAQGLETDAVPIKSTASVQVPAPKMDAPSSIPLESPVPVKAPSRQKPDLPPSRPAPSLFSSPRPPLSAPADRAGNRAVGAWRLWILAVTIGVFGVLGILQWHSRNGQTNQGSPEMLKKQHQNMSTGTQAANDKEVPPSANKIQQPSAETSAAVKQPPDGGNAAVSQRPIPTTDAKAERTKPTPSGYRENSTTTARPSEVESVKATDAGGGPANAPWLRKATATGNPDAPVDLANQYLKGDGVPRSCDKAMLLLTTAAAKRNVRARNRLASMYAVGTCVERNRIQAYRWLSSALAVDPTNNWAQQNRDLIWRQMTPEERIQERNDR
jgi:hypothetical protein